LIEIYDTIEEVASARLVHRVISNLLPGVERPAEPRFLTYSAKNTITELVKDNR